MARKRTRRLIVCPKCGFEFDVTYARATICAPCPSLVQCRLVKCPRCEHEFPLMGYPRIPGGA